MIGSLEAPVNPVPATVDPVLAAVLHRVEELSRVVGALSSRLLTPPVIPPPTEATPCSEHLRTGSSSLPAAEAPQRHGPPSTARIGPDVCVSPPRSESTGTHDGHAFPQAASVPHSGGSNTVRFADSAAPTDGVEVTPRPGQSRSSGLRTARSPERRGPPSSSGASVATPPPGQVRSTGLSAAHLPESGGPPTCTNAGQGSSAPPPPIPVHTRPRDDFPALPSRSAPGTVPAPLSWAGVVTHGTVNKKKCYSNVVHILSILTTSSTVTNIVTPVDSSLMVQDPRSRRSNSPTRPNQRFLIMSTLFLSDGFQGSRYDGLMEICVSLFF